VPTEASLLDEIRLAAAKGVLFLPHAIRQMSRPDRMISTDEVNAVIFTGEVIEEYADDPRGASALMAGKGVEGRPIHVVLSPKDEYLAIITAYVPDAEAWESGYSKRRPS
jgi:hypothetical protein